MQLNRKINAMPPTARDTTCWQQRVVRAHLMPKKLPKTLYVRREVDGDNAYLVDEESMREQLDVTETRLVGEYKLVSQCEVSAEIKTVQK